MDHFAGLDVSVKETSVCIVDDTGRIVREVKVASEPEALLTVLRNPAYHFKRIGLEAGPLSQWLYSALAEAGLPAVCVETRHMRAVLKAQINKTDRNDARGMAQMMRAGLYRPVHVKTLRSQKLRMLLTHRKLLQSKAIAIENDLRGTLRNFGLKVGIHHCSLDRSRPHPALRWSVYYRIARTFSFPRYRERAPASSRGSRFQIACLSGPLQDGNSWAVRPATDTLRSG